MVLNLISDFIIMIPVISIWLKKSGGMDIVVPIADAKNILKVGPGFTGDVRIVNMMKVLQPILFSME
jgi:hypothetical protein